MDRLPEYSVGGAELLKFFELGLVESLAAVIIPLDYGIFFIGALNGANFSGGFAEVTQSLHAVAWNHFLAGGGGIGEWWSARAV